MSQKIDNQIFLNGVMVGSYAALLTIVFTHFFIKEPICFVEIYFFSELSYFLGDSFSCLLSNNVVFSIGGVIIGVLFSKTLLNSFYNNSKYLLPGIKKIYYWFMAINILVLVLGGFVSTLAPALILMSIGFIFILGVSFIFSFLFTQIRKQ